MGRNLCRSVLSIFSILLCFMVVPVSFGSPLDLLPFENLTADIGRGFGDNLNRYSWSMEEFNGHVYVGTWSAQLDWPKLIGMAQNGQLGDIISGGNPLQGIGLIQSKGGEVWRHDGGQNWTRVLKADIDDSGFRIMTEYKGTLYTGSLNSTNGASIFATQNGTTWNELSGGPLANPDNISVRTMQVFHDRLYIGTENNKTGGELWAYNPTNGNWNQKGKFPADPSVAEVTVYKDKLYVGTWDFSDSYKLYRKDGATFTDITPIFPGSENLANLGVMKLIEFKNQLYLGTVNYRDGFTLMRTSDPNNRNGWQIISTNGLGNPDNAYTWAMKEWNGVLYMGTFNHGLNGGKYDPLPIPLDGRGQLWYSADGKTWKLLEGDGFGAPFNYGIRTLEVSDNRLFVGMASNFLIYDPAEMQQYLAALMGNSVGGEIDWSALMNLWGQSGTGCNWIGTQVWASQSVPEPSTMLLLGSGLVGLVGLRRKLKK